MTNHWIDLKNSDVVLVIGGNPAENHPASMLWINRAGRPGSAVDGPGT
jgi:formate dehydrogenase major subunit